MSIVIVSGLPRSGTSLMMQMLAAGGMPVLTDNLRIPDEHNPQGYFEYEPVKATKRDNSWAPLADGKAVKVIYALLRYLPPSHCYRVILMHRELGDTVASQQKMLRNTGKKGAAVTKDQLIDLFTEELRQTKAWLHEQPNFERLDIDYRDCLANPALVAGHVNQFIGGALNEAEMAKAVISL
jgi:hypothetical protein